MAYNSDILLGRITKVNGYEGAVTVKLEKVFTENIPLMESVFLEIEGRPVPFFVSGSEYTGADIMKLRFEGYETIESVSEFIGCNIFLTTPPPDDDQPEEIKSLLGFKVFIQDNILLGTIIEVIPGTGQWLLNIITTEKKEILVPFHEDFIISINSRKKSMVLDIPEGLTEIN
jgi:16S rRNA processing protein RimM